MTPLDDSQIQLIVQRVLAQVLGHAESTVSTEHLPEIKDAAPIAVKKAEARKTIAIGADHGGFELKETLKAELSGMGMDFNDVGTFSKAPVDYPDYALEVAKLVSLGKAWRGIMIDGAGIGSCIVANKVPGVRAGMAYDYSSAVNSREHNDTNVLTLGAGLVGVNLAKQIVKTWLSTEFGGERHARRIEKITKIEKMYFK
ncbi:MAG: ribose 5-phosphate isomerase B [Anaerolineales bacterium]